MKLNLIFVVFAFVLSVAAIFVPEPYWRKFIAAAFAFYFISLIM